MIGHLKMKSNSNITVENWEMWIRK